MIELEHIQKVAGGTTVVDIDALAVSAGQIAAVVGPAGSGKSALLALRAGRTHPTAGSVRVSGLDPARDRDRLGQQIGVLFAENALYERLTARSNLVFHCRLRGLPSSRADETLSQVRDTGIVYLSGSGALCLYGGVDRCRQEEAMKRLKQQCPMIWIYFSWVLYLAGLAFFGLQRDYVSALTWLVVLPLGLWAYVRIFPAKERGTTEAEVIRRAIDQHTRLLHFPRRDLAAWKDERTFIINLIQQGAVPGKRTWRREDLHEC